MDRKYKFETDCVHGVYKAESGQPQTVPIAQSTTYRYYNNDDVADMFNLDSANHMYSRISNPTVSALEGKMALLDGGSAAVATSSGQSATLTTVLNLCQEGDHLISASGIYGGTFNLLAVTLKKMGIDVTFVDQDWPLEKIIASACERTKLIFAETLANPALSVLDFDKFSAAAKTLGVPLVVDNTLASQALCRPLELGANIVVYSTTKYSDGHATCVGGMVIDGGNFDWAQNDKFPGMTEPDPSYHGLKFYEKFGNAAFALKLRGQMLRDLGCVMSPMNAFLTNMGLETLHLRMERHSKNALALAQFLDKHPKVQWVNYPGLPENKYNELAKKYLPDGQSGVLCFGIKGGLAAGEKFIKNIKLTSLVVHVGDIRTSVLHPASATHRQLTEEQQIAAGVGPELIRVSVGIENISDIIADFDQALNA